MNRFSVNDLHSVTESEGMKRNPFIPVDLLNENMLLMFVICCTAINDIMQVYAGRKREKCMM